MTSGDRGHTPPPALPVEAGRLLAEWGETWGYPALCSRVRVEFSPWLTRSLGRCLPRRRVIRLNPVLGDPAGRALFPEVLCHEAAHVAAYALHGRRRPHGPEWRKLMVDAGFEPRASIRVDGTLEKRLRAIEMARDRTGRPGARGRRGRGSTATPTDRNGPRVLYLHRCPVCQSEWTARRPMKRWRCATCIDRESGGELVITTRPAAVPR